MSEGNVKLRDQPPCIRSGWDDVVITKFCSVPGLNRDSA